MGSNRRRRVIWILGIVGALVLAVGLALVTVVDDWSRDLTTNTAATSPEAQDPVLRPLDLRLGPPQAAEFVEQAAARFGNWTLDQRRTEGESQLLHFVRRTRLGFPDDVRVTVSPQAGGARIEVSSASRIGKGDLGQNPRNIKELLEAVRREIDRAP
jgi:uncharacterized protein (DUF1499 family)